VITPWGGTVRHRWLPFVLTGLALAGCASSGTAGDEPTPVWGTPRAGGIYQVTYLVDGIGQAQIEYSGAGWADTTIDLQPLPWSMTFDEPMPDGSSLASVIASNDTGAQLDCQVYVNGVEVVHDSESFAVACTSEPWK
jgi:hypothetical protein